MMRLFTSLSLGLFLPLWLLSFTVQGQITRYVSTTGLNTTPVSATSWATSTTNLQGAIDASQPGDRVWVATGVYKPASASSFAMRDGVAIYGGFVGNENALDSRPSVNPVTSAPSGSTLLGNGSRVITNPSGLTTTAVLDGFVITGGSSVTAGGGMYNSGSSPSREYIMAIPLPGAGASITKSVVVRY